MQRYFIDLSILAPHANTPHAMTQLMSNLHRLLREYDLTDVGAGFPRFGLHDSHGQSSLGDVLRLISVSPESLKRLAGNVTFQSLKSVSVINISQVQEVPETHVKQEVVFFKDSRPIRAMQFHKLDVKADPSIARLSYHQLKGASQLLLIGKKGEKGQAVYPIFISRKTVSFRQDGEFNSYGLTTQTGTSFPVF